MPALASQLDPTSDQFAANRAAMTARLEELEQLLASTRAGGGPKYVDRHRRRGKLLPRERIDLLLDRDSPFLELQPFAAHGSPFAVGASVVTGVGVVEGVECVLIANDPTVRGGASNPFTFRKVFRAMEICEANRLPCVNLVESGGADLPTQAEIFVPGGEMFRRLTELSRAGVPTLALVFGNCTAGGAYVPGMCDYTVFVKDRAKVFLGGPPLVRMATGEESTDEELGGAEMHARISGLADFMAVDEQDCLRIGREIVANLNWRKQGPGPDRPSIPPRHDAEELLGIAPADVKLPFDMREVIARVVDDSHFDEFKPLYGTALLTGWARIHGFKLGVLANQRGILFSEEAQKATQFIQLANQADTPLLFVHNTTGFMVGREYEQGGIIKDGAKMINAVSNSAVPHLVLLTGSSYGAGNYGMAGRAYRPRLLFSWPNAKTAVMGPAQLAGVLSIVARAAAADRGQDYDEAADAKMRGAVEEQIERESVALANSARGYDDAIIDPRDTRTVLGIALSVCHSGPVRGTEGYGVFRM